MIHDVKKIKEGVYLLNDAVKVYNLDFDDDGVTFTVDYDEDILTEQEANEIAEEFILTAVNTFIAEKVKETE